jgi:hypothetical protein
MYYPGIFQEGLLKTTKPESEMPVNGVEIWTRVPQNTKQEC